MFDFFFVFIKCLGMRSVLEISGKKKGEMLVPTRCLITSPGEVLMMHPDENVVRFGEFVLFCSVSQFIFVFENHCSSAVAKGLHAEIGPVARSVRRKAVIMRGGVTAPEHQHRRHWFGTGFKKA